MIAAPRIIWVEKDRDQIGLVVGFQRAEDTDEGETLAVVRWRVVGAERLAMQAQCPAERPEPMRREFGRFRITYEFPRSLRFVRAVP